MRFMLTTASKDLRRRLADPAALLLWIGLPIVIGGLMRLINGDSGPVPKARLLLVDQDNTFVSRIVAGAGRQGRLSQFLDIEEVTAEQGQQRIAAGDGTALLILPSGFQDGVLNERPTELTLLTNPAQRILPGILEEGLKMTAEAAFYLQRLFGGPVREIVADRQRSEAPTDDSVAAIGRSINQNITRVRDTLVPPVIGLEMRTEADPSATLDFGTLFLPGLLFMSVLFMANGMSLDIWIEKERGTLRRAISTPQRLGFFLAGKLAASTVLVGLVAMVALALGVAVFNVRVVRAPLAIAWACYAGAAFFCYFIFLQVLAATARGGMVLGQLMVFPLIMIGGSFFPFDVMPAWMARIGRWTPNGLAVARIADMLFGEVQARPIVLAALGIGIPAAAAFLLAVRRLRGRFATN
jgi:ABC-type multidrug transport system permease subunit